MEFVDGFGRVHDDLRISVTDRCNLRCAYCMPSQPEWFDRREVLSYEEIARIARIAVGRGVRKLRVTGGEPLVRRDLEGLIRVLASIPRVTDLSMTTNGVLLAEAARRMVDAGLRRVNVSLDTLRPERFRVLTGRDGLERVIEGIEAARAAGMAPVKLNAVLLRGINDDEAIDLAEFARARRCELRFIEFMPLENDGSWKASRMVTGADVRRRIESVWPLLPDPGRDPRDPATRFLFRDGGGAIGFINSVSEPFCGACSRLRLTSDGKLRVCLHDTAEVDLKGPMRKGASDDEVEALLVAGLATKTRGGALHILDRPIIVPAARTMHQIGG